MHFFQLFIDLSIFRCLNESLSPNIRPTSSGKIEDPLAPFYGSKTVIGMPQSRRHLEYRSHGQLTSPVSFSFSMLFLCKQCLFGTLIIDNSRWLKSLLINYFKCYPDRSADRCYVGNMEQYNLCGLSRGQSQRCVTRWPKKEIPKLLALAPQPTCWPTKQNKLSSGWFKLECHCWLQIPKLCVVTSGKSQADRDLSDSHVQSSFI